MNISGLVKSVIEAEHGRAIAEQFEKTFNNEEKFEEANFNALRYIRNIIEEILRSRILNDYVQDELQEYRDDLEDYMVGARQ